MSVLEFILGLIVVLVAGICVIFYIGFKFEKINNSRKTYTKVYDLPKKSNRNNKNKEDK